jgi:hypothetical protein
MRKMVKWMLAAILICGATVLASCSNDDNSANTDQSKQ